MIPTNERRYGGIVRAAGVFALFFTLAAGVWAQDEPASDNCAGNGPGHDACLQGVAFYKQSDYEKSAKAFEQAIALEGGNAEYHHKLAISFYGQSNLQQAEDHFRRATTLDPSKGGYFHDLAWVYNAMNKHDQAVRAINQAIALESKNSKFRHALAMIYLDSDMQSAAERTLLESADIDPAYAKTFITLGYIFKLQEKNDKAIETLEKAIGLTKDPNLTIQAAKQLAYALEGAGRYAEALEAAARVTQTKPDSAANGKWSADFRERIRSRYGVSSEAPAEIAAAPTDAIAEREDKEPEETPPTVEPMMEPAEMEPVKISKRAEEMSAQAEEKIAAEPPEPEIAKFQSVQIDPSKSERKPKAPKPTKIAKSKPVMGDEIFSETERMIQNLRTRLSGDVQTAEETAAEETGSEPEAANAPMQADVPAQAETAVEEPAEPMEETAQEPAPTAVAADEMEEPIVETPPPPPDERVAVSKPETMTGEPAPVERQLADDAKAETALRASAAAPEPEEEMIPCPMEEMDAHEKPEHAGIARKEKMEKKALKERKITKGDRGANTAKIEDRGRKTPEAAANPVKSQAMPLMPEPEALAFAAEHYHAALAAAGAGDLDGAEREIAESLRFDPRNDDAYNLKSAIQLQMGNSIGALSSARDAAKVGPRNALAVSLQGAALERLGRDEEATEAFENALAIDPNEPAALAHLGSSALDRGLYAEAFGQLNDAVNAGFTESAAINNLALVHLQRNDPAQAEALVKQAVSLDRDDPRLQENLYFLHYIQGRAADFHSSLKSIGRPRDMGLDPVRDVMRAAVMAPASPVDFAAHFKNKWKTAKVLTLPFKNPRGSGSWSVNPGDDFSFRLAQALKQGGYFQVDLADAAGMRRGAYGSAVPDRPLTEGERMELLEMDRDLDARQIARLGEILDVDLIVHGESLSPDAVSRTVEYYGGLKKKDLSEVEASVLLTVYDARSGRMLFAGPVSASAGFEGVSRDQFTARNRRQLEEESLRRLVEKCETIIKQRNNLYDNASGSGPVKNLTDAGRRRAEKAAARRDAAEVRDFTGIAD